MIRLLTENGQAAFLFNGKKSLAAAQLAGFFASCEIPSDNLGTALAARIAEFGGCMPFPV